jgi:nucleotide-binding universal stress UspA family protein
VLVAVDTSGAAEAIVRRGAQLAASMQASLHLVQVVELLPTIALGGSLLMVPSSTRLIQQGWLEVERLQAIAQPAVSETRGHVVVGHAAAKIVELAATLGADVLVIGTHDASKLESLLFGSVATELVRKAPCPVFVVRGPASNRARTQPEIQGTLEEGGATAGSNTPAPDRSKGVDHSFHTLAEKLRCEHAMLTRRCADLVQRAESGDWRECDVIWDEFCSLLDIHMTEEETSLLPVYERGNATDLAVAGEIRRDHAAIRAATERLGVSIQVHAVRASDIKALVDQLETHARRENQSLYGWLEAHEASARSPSTPPAAPRTTSSKESSA